MATTETPTERTDPDLVYTGLLQRIADSDQEAVAEFYDRSSSFVFGLILRIVGDRGEAEEVTLDVYTQVWRQAGNYDAVRGRPLSWVLTIARSRAIDRLRSRRNQQRAKEQSLEPEAPVPDGAPNPEQSSLEARRRSLVLSALDSLQSEQRQAIELAYFSGMSHSEIAAHLSQPLGTVKTRIRLGMMRLRESLQPFAEAI